MKSSLGPAVALALMGLSAAGQTIEFRTLAAGSLEGRLKLAHPKVAVRYARMKELFEREGCANFREQLVKGSKEPNLICAVPGGSEGARKIVVGAHFDSAGGDGIIDNWTGAVLLPSLASFAAASPRKHSMEFVAFAAEEKGLVGSSVYLKSLTDDERMKIAAVVTMDSLGLSYTKYWPNSSTTELALLAAALAQAMKLEFSGVNLDAVGSTDSMTFFKARVPVLSLHSVTQETWKTVNSSRDVWKSVSWKDYYDSHRFVSALLSYLDQKLP